ncbi:MAG: hypothetical protein AAF244_01425 [Pseudomonadota bacterium]
MEEAAKRIIICGFDKVEQHIKYSNIGLICVVMPGISEEIDYGSVPVLDCYHHGIYKSDDSILALEAKNQVENNLETIANFLNEDPNKNILIHCNAGMHRSPPFAAMVLLYLQGNKPDIYKAMGAVQKISQNACLGSIQDYKTLLDVSKEELEQIILDYFLVKHIRNGLLRGEGFETSFQNAKNFFNPVPSKKSAIDAYRKFNLDLPTDTALCDADNDPQEHTPSLPRTPVSRANPHMGRDGPS